MSEDMLKLYRERLAEGERRFQKKYEAIAASRQSYKQFIPDEALDVESSAGYSWVGEDGEEEIPANTSQYHYPIHRAISRTMIENLTANSPRYEVESNDVTGSIAKKHMEQEFKKVLAKENIKLKQNIAYFHATEGTVVSQTTTRMLNEKIRMPNGEEKAIPQGRTIDMIIYDPMMVIPDYDASPSDPMGTSKFIIVTIGRFSPLHIKEHYGVEIEAGGTGTGSEMDMRQYNAQQDSGKEPDGLFPIREYYLTDGYRRTIINDEVMLDPVVNENGIMGRIPVNICQTNFDPDCIFGVPIYSDVAPSAEMMSAAMNQICDNTSRNNNAPFIAPKNSGLDGLTMNDHNPNEVIAFDFLAAGLGGQASGFDIRKMITKLNFPEVTQGAMFQFEEARNAIFYVMGINPTDFGIQEKQIRTNDVAGMIGEASTKSTSDFIMRLEAGHINPTTADMQRIMGIYFDDFDFPEEVTQEMVLSMKSLRVVAGSYLAEDRMTRLGKLQVLLQRAIANPQAYKHRDLEAALIDSLGVGTPEEWLKTAEEIAAQMKAQQEMQAQAMEGGQGGQ